MSSKHVKRRGKKSSVLNADLLNHEEELPKRQGLSPDSHWRELRFRQYLRMRMKNGLKAKNSVWVDIQGRPVTLAERILRFRLEKEKAGESGNNAEKLDTLHSHPVEQDGPGKPSLRELVEEYKTMREKEGVLSNGLMEQIDQVKTELQHLEQTQLQSPALGRASSSTISLGDSATHINAKARVNADVVVFTVEEGGQSGRHPDKASARDGSGLTSPDSRVKNVHLSHLASDTKPPIRSGHTEHLMSAANTGEVSTSRHRPDSGSHDVKIPDIDKLVVPHRVSVLSARFQPLSPQTPDNDVLDSDTGMGSQEEQENGGEIVRQMEQAASMQNDDHEKRTLLPVDERQADPVQKSTESVTNGQITMPTGKTNAPNPPSLVIDAKVRDEERHHIELDDDNRAVTEHVKVSLSEHDEAEPDRDTDHPPHVSVLEADLSAPRATTEILGESPEARPFVTDDRETTDTPDAATSRELDHRIYEFIGYGCERAYTLPEFISHHRAGPTGPRVKFFMRRNGNVVKVMPAVGPSYLQRRPKPRQSFLPDIAINNGVTGQSRVASNISNQPQLSDSIISQTRLTSAGFLTPAYLPPVAATSMQGTQSVGRQLQAVHRALDNIADIRPTTLMGQQLVSHCEQLPHLFTDGRYRRIIGLYNELKGYSAFYKGPSDVSMAMARGRARNDMRIEWGYLQPETRFSFHCKDHKTNASPEAKQGTASQKENIIQHDPDPPKQSHPKIETRVVEKLPRIGQDANSTDHFLLPSKLTNRPKVNGVTIKRHQFIYLREISLSRFVNQASGDDEQRKYLMPLLDEKNSSRDSDNDGRDGQCRSRLKRREHLPRIAYFQSRPRQIHIHPRHASCHGLDLRHRRISGRIHDKNISFPGIQIKEEVTPTSNRQGFQALDSLRKRAKLPTLQNS